MIILKFFCLVLGWILLAGSLGESSQLKVQVDGGEDCWIVLDENTIGLAPCDDSPETLFQEVTGGFVEHSKGAKLESVAFPGLCLARSTGGYHIHNYRYSFHEDSVVSVSWCLTECVEGSCGGDPLNGNVMLLSTCDTKGTVWINRGSHVINSATGNCLQLCTASDARCTAGVLGGVNIISGVCEDTATMSWSKHWSPLAPNEFINMTVDHRSKSARCLDTCLGDSESGARCNDVADSSTTVFLNGGISGKNVFGQKCGAYFAGDNQAWRLSPVSRSDGMLIPHLPETEMCSSELRLMPCDSLLTDRWTMRAKKMMPIGGDLEVSAYCALANGADLKLADCEDINNRMLWEMIQLGSTPKVVPKVPAEDNTTVAEPPAIEPTEAVASTAEPVEQYSVADEPAGEEPIEGIPPAEEPSERISPAEEPTVGAPPRRALISDDSAAASPSSIPEHEEGIFSIEITTPFEGIGSAANSLSETTDSENGESANSGGGGGSVIGIGAALAAGFVVICFVCYWAQKRNRILKKGYSEKEIGIAVGTYTTNQGPPPNTSSNPTVSRYPQETTYQPPVSFIESSPAVSLLQSPPNPCLNTHGIVSKELKTRMSEGNVESILDSVSSLTEGSVFADRYTIESKRIIGRSGVVCFATNKFSKEPVAIKFFVSSKNYQHSKEMHHLLSSYQFCRMEDAIDESAELPSALVFQRGDYTLTEWLAKSRPNSLSQKLALSQILEALVELHRQRLVHRDLKPDNIMWFSSEHMWKLVDFDTCVHSGISAPTAYTLYYASPEVLYAQDEVALETSADMWSFGIVAFEVLSGMRFYGPQPSFEDVVAAVSSPTCLPSLDCIPEAQAKRLIKNLICIDPRQRWTAAAALQNAFFKSGEDTLQQENRWNKVTEKLDKIVSLVEITAEEVRSSNLMVSISLEYFHKRSDPAEPFHLREGLEVCSISDDNIPDQPVYLLNMGSSYRLRVNLTHDHNLQIPLDKVLEVKMTPPDGKSVILQTVRVISRKGFEFVAYWEPQEHGSQRLTRRASGFGGVYEKYVPMDISITFGGGTRHNVKGRIFCRMHPPGSKFRFKKFARVFHKAWEEAPQWMRDGARGTVFLSTLAVNPLVI